MPRSWRAPFALDWRELDGEIVAYCDVSGDTFKVTPVAHLILQELGLRQHDLESLSAFVANASGAGSWADVRAAVEQTVADLETLGIIEPVSL